MENTTREYFESKVTIIKDENRKEWFRGRDVALILGYAGNIKAIRMHVLVENIKKMNEILPAQNEQKSKNLQPHTVYINEKGLKSLICKSRTTNSLNIAKALNIDVNNHKYETKESETLGAIKKAFKGETMKEQYIVLNHRIDLYFPSYNLAIECDEFDHKDRCPIMEKNRHDKITKKLKCKWLRFDPDDKDFNIFDVINRIYLVIRQ